MCVYVCLCVCVCVCVCVCLCAVYVYSTLNILHTIPKSTISVFLALSLSQLYTDSDFSLAIQRLLSHTLSESLTSSCHFFPFYSPLIKPHQGAISAITAPFCQLRLLKDTRLFFLRAAEEQAVRPHYC